MESVLAWVAAHRKLLTVISGAATSLGVYQVPNRSAAGSVPAGTGPESPPPGPVVTAPATRNAGVRGAPPSAAPSEVAGAGQTAGVTGGPPSSA
jgi:hypothetical protein